MIYRENIQNSNKLLESKMDVFIKMALFLLRMILQNLNGDKNM